ncbi:MAG: hypothetical protein CSB15_00180 [Clostridiales bacterium]|nr:MAG: hypothetical protein CSB15_00180 [Clostridiales bacterium]
MALKFIKNLIVCFSIITISTIVTGCETVFKSPSDLLERPKLAVNEKLAHEVIYKNISNSAKFIRPLKPGNLSSMGYISKYDKNKENEFFAFYKNNQTQKVGFIILKENMQNIYSVFAKEEITDSDINYAEFIDLNKDGNKDIIIGTENKGSIFKKAHIFLKTNYGYKYIWSEPYTEIIVDDLDKNGITDIFILALDRNTKAYAKVFEVNNNTIKEVDKIKMDQDINSYYDVKSGRVNYKKKGIFIDFNIGLKSATNILFYKDYKLSLAIDPFIIGQSYNSTIKNKRLSSTDINNDYNIEIPIIYNPTYSSHNIDENGIYGWYVFDDIDKKYNLKRLSYQSKNDNYKITIPKLWTEYIIKDKMTIISSVKSQKQDYLNVYYIDDKNNLLWLARYELIKNSELNEKIASDIFKDFEYVEIAKNFKHTLIVYYPKEFNNIDKKYLKIYRNLLLDKKTLENSAKLIK